MRMIVRILFLISLLLVLNTSFARDKPEGFMWYNLPNKEASNQVPKSVPFKKLSPMMQRKVLVYETRKALAKFDVNPTKENALAFIKWQQFWMHKTTLGKRAFQEAMLENPKYNYSVTHPTSNLGTKLREDLKAKKAATIIHNLSETHGLLYFYRGANPYDKQEAAIINSFSERFHIHVLPISVDGVVSELLPESKLDHGQAEKLNIKYFPAIMLFDSRTHQLKPVSFGFATQDVIANQLLMVATNFKGDDL
jgi:type-F conjugative transfer system pilin assembly protein TraF